MSSLQEGQYKVIDSVGISDFIKYRMGFTILPSEHITMRLTDENNCQCDMDRLGIYLEMPPQTFRRFFQKVS